MSRYLLPAALALVTSLWGAVSSSHFDDPGQFARELRRLATARNGIPEVPPEWEVSTPQGVFRISTDPLRHGDAKKQREWLEYVAEAAESYQATSGQAADVAGARNRLDRIFKQREFSDAAQPKSWLELVEERIGAWLLMQLQKIFILAAQHPTTSQTLFWTSVCGGLGFLAWRLFPIWDRQGTALTLEPPADAAGNRSEEQWIAAARQAAEEGDFSRAIQCAYWAGVMRLQDTGRLSRNSALTPREYLKAAAGMEAAGHLRLLTAALERFWYARRPATADNLAGCWSALEGLGCRVS